MQHLGNPKNAVSDFLTPVANVIDRLGNRAWPESACSTAWVQDYTEQLPGSRRDNNPEL